MFRQKKALAPIVLSKEKIEELSSNDPYESYDPSESGAHHFSSAQKIGTSANN